MLRAAVLGALAACAPAPAPDPLAAVLVPGTPAPTWEVTTSTPTRFTATVRLPALGDVPLVRDGRTWHRLGFAGAGRTRRVGAPELPYLVLTLALPVPPDGSPPPLPTAQVSEDDVVASDGYPAWPAQPLAFAAEDVAGIYPEAPGFTWDPVAYAVPAVRPADPVEVVPTRVGGLPAAEIRLYPARYTSGADRLRVARTLRVDVDLAPAGAADPPWVEVEIDDGGVDIAGGEVSALLANPEVVEVRPVPHLPPGPTPADPMPHLLIVSDPALMDAARDLAAHKQAARRMRVELRDVTSFASGATPTARQLSEGVAALYTANRRLAFAEDDRDPALPLAADLWRAALYTHRRGEATWVGADVVLRAAPDAATVRWYLSVDDDEAAELLVTASPPYADLTLAAETTPGMFDRVLYEGPAAVVDGVLRLEVPLDDVRDPNGAPVPGANAWIVAQEQESDRLPDAGAVPLVFAGGEPTLSAVILVGDVTAVPMDIDHTTVEAWPPISDVEDPDLPVASDRYVADLDGDGLAEVSAVGRLPVETPAEAARAVGKIIAWELDDVASRFAPGALVAAAWDDTDDDGVDDGLFVGPAERAARFLEARGHAVDRRYVAPDGDDPRWFADGSAVPADLRRPTWPWAVTPEALRDAVGAYTSQLVLHVDHGWVGGWASPWLSTDEVDDLPADVGGGTLPIVLSLNCASGYLDTEVDVRRYGSGPLAGTTVPIEDQRPEDWWSHPPRLSFAEVLVRHPAGAVAVVAATRGSSVVYNEHLADGLMAAIYPGYPVWDEAVAGADGWRSLGGVLEDAKAWVAARAGEDAWSARNYRELYHLFGDPTLRVARLPRD